MTVWLCALCVCVQRAYMRERACVCVRACACVCVAYTAAESRWSFEAITTDEDRGMLTGVVGTAASGRISVLAAPVAEERRNIAQWRL